MLDVFSRFAVDLKAETEGVWKDFYGAKVLIARTGNEKFNKKLNEVFEKHREDLSKKDEAADKLADRLMVEVFADTLILDWEGIAYQGKEVKYSRQAVIDLLSPPEMRDFRYELLSLADDAENFRLQLEEEQTKN